MIPPDAPEDASLLSPSLSVVQQAMQITPAAPELDAQAS
jgi:hypothetical protein